MKALCFTAFSGVPKSSKEEVPTIKVYQVHLACNLMDMNYLSNRYFTYLNKKKHDKNLFFFIFFSVFSWVLCLLGFLGLWKFFR